MQTVHQCTTLSGYIFAINACIDNRKKTLLNSNISSTCLHSMVIFSTLTAKIVGEFWAFQQISTVFTSWLHYCTDVAKWRSTNFAQCLAISWAGTLYILFQGLLPPNGILPGAKFTWVQVFLHSSFLLYWQCYCTALKQWPSAKLCGLIQGMELQDFCSSSFSTEGATYITRVATTLGIGPHSSFLYSYKLLLPPPHHNRFMALFPGPPG